MTATFVAGHAPSDGEEIYYELTGDADEVVVLCHGLAGNHASWFQQVPVLAERYRVLTWDQRGLGQSSNRAAKAGPEVAAADLVVLLDHIGVESAHLVGQSMGGWVVMGFTLAASERVRSLVITDSPAGVYTDEVLRVMRARDLEPVTDVVGVHPAVGDRLRTEDPVKAYLYQQIASFRSGSDGTDTIMRRTGATRYAISDVAKLRVPTLLVVGAEDRMIPPAIMHELGRVIEGSRVVEIPGAGHSPYFEQPEAWNAAVLEFLASTARE